MLEESQITQHKECFYYEYVDDKRLGQWLKAALGFSAKDPKVEAVKLEILFTYTQAWRFVYSIYNGKCLLQALAHFYGGAGDNDPPTCFIANNPFCDKLLSWQKKYVR